MGLIVSSQFARARRLPFRGGACGRAVGMSICAVVFGGSSFVLGQSVPIPEVADTASHAQSSAVGFSHTARTRRFLSGRITGGDGSAAQAMAAARQQQAAMLLQQAASPQV